MAYKVDPHDIPEVMAYLNHREKDGYTTMQLPFHPSPDLNLDPFPTLMYVATDSNPTFLGPAPIEAIADQVVRSRGLSGCNTEYVLNLARAMREITPLARDEHLFALERRINQMVEECARKYGDRRAEQDTDCTCSYCGLIRRTSAA